MALFLVTLLLILIPFHVKGSPPGPLVTCNSGNANCTVTNSYGAFPDRSTCRVAGVAYPSNEQELLKTVSDASAKKQHMKVLTAYSHSIPKLSCPGGPDGQGLVISSKRLNRTVSVDLTTSQMTFEAGITLPDLLSSAAAYGLALPTSPYWQGVSLGGLVATGSHGSSTFGKGSAVHEYVVGMRIVVPITTPVNGSYAKIISLGLSDPNLLAAKVSFGVLGVVSQITLQLEPMFKRSVTNRVVDDVAFEQSISSFAATTYYGDITWEPSQKLVIYRDDFKIPINTSGSGVNDFVGFQSQPTLVIAARRAAEELQEALEDSTGRCLLAKAELDYLRLVGMGFKNTAGLFTGYPVIGNQSNIQSSGSCLRSPQDNLLTACGWDPLFNGLFFHQTTVSIPFTNITSFISEVKTLRDINPDALCGVELYYGFYMRFVLNSTAYLGKTHDSVDIDITYYRSRDANTPRLFEDVLEEIEQMALFKYKGLPHLGKNRNVGFIGYREKLGSKVDNFVSVMQEYDPDGLFSSNWTDAVLGLRGQTVEIVKNGCALEGLCICSQDIHCAPDKGYYCVAGQVYQDARVCRKITGLKDMI